jgi:hypothetical protein
MCNESVISLAETPSRSSSKLHFFQIKGIQLSSYFSVMSQSEMEVETNRVHVRTLPINEACSLRMKIMCVLKCVDQDTWSEVQVHSKSSFKIVSMKKPQ